VTKHPRSGAAVRAASRLLCLLASACGDSPAAPATATSGEGRGARRARVEELTAMGYAGEVEDEPDGAASGVVFRDAGRSAPGYDLYTVSTLSFAELIDEAGGVVRRWSWRDAQGRPLAGWTGNASAKWERSVLLETGELLVVGSEHTDWGDGEERNRIADDARYLMKLGWDGELLWKRRMRVHHDIEVTPDGRLLTLTFSRRVVRAIDPVVPVRVDELTLLDQEGRVLETRPLLRAVRARPERFTLWSKEPDGLGGETWIDLFHANSCEWMRHAALADRHPIYAPDNVLVCFRHQHCIAVIDWKANEVVWSWGKDEIWGPHDAQMLADGSILVFDNGLGQGRSRALVVDPLRDEIVWQWEADPPESFYTRSQGSVQRLPNGNFLLAESERGRALEITAEGERVWEFRAPHRTRDGKRAAIARIVRHPRAFVDAILERHGD